MEILEKHVDIQRDKYRTRGRDMIAPDRMECDHDVHDDYDD